MPRSGGLVLVRKLRQQKMPDCQPQFGLLLITHLLSLGDWHKRLYINLRTLSEAIRK
jgi:hypothetical protein